MSNTTLKEIQVKESGNSRGPGYFQISSTRMNEIANDPELGFQALLVYIVAAGGVNSLCDEPRASTHGVRAIRSKASMTSKVSELAIEALKRKGYLRSPPAGTSVSEIIAHQVGDDQPLEIPITSPGVKAKGKNSYPIQFLVDPDQKCDLAISQKFLRKEIEDEKSGEKVHRGSLLKLRENIRLFENMSAQECFLDALMVFFALHKEQAFDTSAGIDPRVLHSRFIPIVPDELGPGTDYIVPLNGVPNWRLVTMRRPQNATVVRSGFAKATLGRLRQRNDGPSLEARFDEAIRNLLAAELLYTAHVVWDDNPLNSEDGKDARPLFTLYVENRWDEKRETFLQYKVLAAIKKTETISGAQTWGGSRGKVANNTGSNIYCYIVPDSRMRRSTLLMQYRARWWPDDEDTKIGFADDSERIKQWTEALDNLTNRA